MNIKKIHILFYVMVFSFSIVFSCKKDKVSPTNKPYATIEPLSYFPVYPGSYWKYVNANNDTTIIETAPEYQLDFYTEAGQHTSDTFYVPIYNGVPIWGYEEHTGSISYGGSYPLATILSETLPVWQSWIIKNWGAIKHSRRVSAKDTTITINGTDYYPTIVIDQFWYSGGPPNMPMINKRYYTKNIGLIKEDTYNFIDSSVVTKEIIDYHINY